MTHHNTLKPSEIINQLRYEFELKLKDNGVSWNKAGVLNAFDRAVGATAFWYADMKMDERAHVED